MEMVSVKIVISSQMEPISKNASIVGLIFTQTTSSMRTISLSVPSVHIQSISGNAIISISPGIPQSVVMVDISSLVRDASISSVE